MINKRFKLLNKIGAGGFGEVWNAYDLCLKMTVAIKLVTHHSVNII